MLANSCPLGLATHCLCDFWACPLNLSELLISFVIVRPHLRTKEFPWHLPGFILRKAARIHRKVEFPLQFFLFTDTFVGEAKSLFYVTLDSVFSEFLPLLPRT